MRFAIFPIVMLALGACAPDDLGTVQMAPRALPQSQAEVAFVSRLFNDIQPRSIAEDREYCGLIGLDPAGALVATEPRRGRVSSCLPPDPRFVGFTVVASYHTHGSYSPEFLTEVPSFDDMRTDIEDDTDGYIATPGGRLWYVDARARVARQVCGVSCLIPDPNYREDPDFPVRQTYTLNQLRAY
ncbi:DUF4329 domain-containing protein [uncultured Tateyamaria sp.]|uniref:DUF4329 domain-containing protein n=1 Tax=uncultured Tateyamaria sp. TaxID=455651 RepID=UPI0026118634|nr:DUF4329 domain-containing protein [uncultured Tateyamaria sp.]